MSARQAPFLTAFLTLIGTIIGAGVFGIPAIMQEVGVITGSVVFWAMALIILATHLLYVEIISRDKVQRRLPGYAGAILGKWASKVAVVANTLHLVGANLAYLILGGQFLAVIAKHFGIFDNVFAWQVIFWLGGIVVLMAGLRMLSEIEASLTWMLLAIMSIMIILALPQARIEGAVLAHWTSAHTALGVFIFSLSGFTVIPEVYEITRRNARLTRLAILSATFGSALLTWLFGVSIYLAGRDINLANPSALDVLFPASIWWLLPLFGFLAVATSYITISYDLQAMYSYDLKFSRPLALALTLGIPFLLLIFTSRNFISTIGIVGSLFGAISGFLVAVMSAIAMRRAESRQPIWWKLFVPLGVAAVFLFTFVQKLAFSVQ